MSVNLSKLFKYLWYYVNINHPNDINMKKQVIQYMCGTIKRTLDSRARTETLLSFMK